MEVLFALQRVMGGARIGPAGSAGTRGSSNLVGRDGLVRPITPDDDDDERGATRIRGRPYAFDQLPLDITAGGARRLRLANCGQSGRQQNAGSRMYGRLSEHAR